MEVMRLTVKAHSTAEAVLAVEGWVSGQDVDLLAQEGTRWLSRADRLVLDLRQLRGIDPPGIDLLKTWRTDRLALRNGSPFVTALLEAHGFHVSNHQP